MEETDTLRMARNTLAKACPETVEAAVVIHKPPERSELKLKINNYLALTPTSLRIYSLGNSFKPKKEVAAWPRGEARVDGTMVERSSFFASTGSSITTRRYRLRISAEGRTFFVEAMADAGLDEGVRDMLEAGAMEAEPDPEVREAIQGLQEINEEVDAMVRAIVEGTGGVLDKSEPEDD